MFANWDGLFKNFKVVFGERSFADSEDAMPNFISEVENVPEEVIEEGDDDDPDAVVEAKEEGEDGEEAPIS